MEPIKKKDSNCWVCDKQLKEMDKVVYSYIGVLHYTCAEKINMIPRMGWFTSDNKTKWNH
jgi:hypothetical protein